MKEEELSMQWQKIGMRILMDKNASRSEVESAIIGVHGSNNEWLKEQLKVKRQTAWKAKNVKDN
tara:strand:+ start:1028 stop:1219 length:192 start_codon:yes stop_codon:yes gene_type:complete